MTSKRGNKTVDNHIEGYTGSIIEHNEKQFADDHQRLLRAFYASVSKESGNLLCQIYYDYYDYCDYYYDYYRIIKTITSITTKFC